MATRQSKKAAAAAAAKPAAPAVDQPIEETSPEVEAQPATVNEAPAVQPEQGDAESESPADSPDQSDNETATETDGDGESSGDSPAEPTDPTEGTEGTDELTKDAPASGALDAPEPPATESENEPKDPAIPAGAVGAHTLTGREYLYDSATGKAPDPDTMFVPANEVGNAVTLTCRLIKSVDNGPDWPSTSTLVMGQGTEVDSGTAQLIIDAVRAQESDA